MQSAFNRPPPPRAFADRVMRGERLETVLAEAPAVDRELIRRHVRIWTELADFNRRKRNNAVDAPDRE